MTEEAIDRLRRRLRVSGTSLAQTPPDWQGLTLREAAEVYWADMRAEAQRAREGQPVPVLKLATARDRYGWKSLPSGSLYFGKGE